MHCERCELQLPQVLFETTEMKSVMVNRRVAEPAFFTEILEESRRHAGEGDEANSGTAPTLKSRHRHP
jgi:hypothetical protein